CGSLAYKLKKRVSLGFFAFSTSGPGQLPSKEELALHRRLAPSLYLGGVAVRGIAEAPHIGGDGALVDHAVRMRRFPAGALFSERLAQGTLSTAELDALARRIADFHRQAPVAPPDSDFRTPAAIEGAVANLVTHVVAAAALRG